MVFVKTSLFSLTFNGVYIHSILFLIYNKNMKFTYTNSKDDFFIYCLTQIINKNNNKLLFSNDNYGKELGEALSINKDIINSIILTNKNKVDIYNSKNLKKYNKYQFLYDKFEKIDNKKMFILTEELNKITKEYVSFLTNIFGKSDLSESINISFIHLIDNSKLFFKSFTTRVNTKKIFFVFNKNINLKDKLIFNKKILILLHEFTHIFLFQNKKFQNILKKEWNNNYKNINPVYFRNNIEEILTSTIVFPYFYTGLAFEILDYKENQDSKTKLFSKNKFIKISYEFLILLKNNNEENKLDNYISIFIKNLYKKGFFNK